MDEAIWTGGRLNMAGLDGNRELRELVAELGGRHEPPDAEEVAARSITREAGLAADPCQRVRRVARRARRASPGPRRGSGTLPARELRAPGVSRGVLEATLAARARGERARAPGVVGRDAPSVKAFAWAGLHLAVLPGPVAAPAPGLLEVYHEGRCGRSARSLTVPGSILSGPGPECAEKV